MTEREADLLGGMVLSLAITENCMRTPINEKKSQVVFALVIAAFAYALSKERNA